MLPARTAMSARLIFAAYRSRSSCCLAVRTRHSARAETASNTATDAPANPANAGRRRHHSQARSASPTRRAGIGSPAAQCSRSSARSNADSYRRPASFLRHFRQIVSRSRGTAGFIDDGGGGSFSSTWLIVARGDVPSNTRRPVSVSQRIAPRLYTSAATVRSFALPAACSGGM